MKFYNGREEREQYEKENNKFKRTAPFLNLRNNKLTLVNI